MDPKNVAEFGRALEGEESLLAYVEKELAEMAADVAEDPSKILDGFELSEADRAVLQREELAQVIREATEDLARGGPWGWVDDDLVFVKPWGFDISEIRVPVEVRYGLTDVLVPAAHGEWLGGPRAQRDRRRRGREGSPVRPRQGRRDHALAGHRRRTDRRGRPDWVAPSGQGTGPERR